MPIKNLGKEWKDTLRDTVDVVRDKVKSVDAEEMKGNLQNAVETAKEKVVEASDKVNEQIRKRLQKGAPTNERDETGTPSVSVRGALEIIYYLMAADGEIFHGEEEKYDSIGKELDPDFERTKSEIVSECKARLATASDKESYADALRAGVDRAVAASDGAADAPVASRLLVWDLLTVAYSDERCDDAERNFIDYVVKTFQMEQEVYLEMQSAILTALDLEKELDWIKTVNKPYLTIEEHVNEINKRKSTVMESVIALISR